MNRVEFKTCWEKLCGLFPKWKPTDAERDVWTGKLLPHPEAEVLKSIEAHYAGKHFNDPDLNAILAPLRREPTRQEVEKNWEEYVLKSINEEKAKIDHDLEIFSRNDREEFKRAILEHETDRAWMAPIPVTNQVWKDLIWERFIQNRATIYLAERPGARRVDGRDEPCMVRPEQHLTRDEYWYILWQDRVRREAEGGVAKPKGVNGVSSIGEVLAGGGGA